MPISSSDASVFELYLRDLSVILLELYGQTASDSSGYELGRHMAFLEVISLMQQQADAFEIPRDSIFLPNKDID